MTDREIKSYCRFIRIMEMKIDHGLSQADIAVRFGVSIGMVGKWFAEGRRIRDVQGYSLLSYPNAPVYLAAIAGMSVGDIVTW